MTLSHSPFYINDPYALPRLCLFKMLTDEHCLSSPFLLIYHYKLVSMGIILVSNGD